MSELDRREELKDVMWQQGRLLITDLTRRWTKEQRDEVDDVERCTAFAYFSARDQGRGRVHLYQFASHEECAVAVEEHNRMLWSKVRVT